MSMNIHPDWLQVEQELGSRPVLAGRYEDIRAGSDQLMAVLNPLYALPSPEPKVSGETLPSGIVVRIFHPGVPSQNSLPVGIFFHSGGWTSGNVEGEKATCYHLAHYVPAIIVAVGYRLAPEYKAPTAHRDAVEAFLWTVTNSRRLGGDPKKLFCIGGSAGGNLALSVVLRAIELKMSVAGVAAMVPVTVHPDAVPPQHKSLYTSYAESTNTPIINTSSMNTFYETYDPMPTDPLVSVLLHPDLSKMPRAYIVGCTADPLRDDARLLVHELERMGVPVTFDEYEGMPHYFWIFPQLKQRAEFLEKLVQGVQFILQE